jgi:hypothetical protein
MVIAAEMVKVDEQTLTALEGQFISRGLRVVSSAITGRVVASADTRGPTEGAAKLPTLERALLLAKGANADCVFYLLNLDVGGPDRFRYFVWRSAASSLAEVDFGTYDAAPSNRRWFVGGPGWNIEGKVVDVETAAVLGIVRLEHSTPYAADRHLAVKYSATSLVPRNGYYGWRLASPEDLGGLAGAMMSRLAAEVRGTTK